MGARDCRGEAYLNRWCVASYTVAMDHAPLPLIATAVAYGRGRRGWKDPASWVRSRAQLLTALFDGASRAQLRTSVAADARRSRLESAEAAVACTQTWQRWCGPGNTEACHRLQQRVRN